MRKIEFSGCDGSGKTTAAANLVQYLKNKGCKVLDTREVGNPHIPACVKLRCLALDPDSKLSGKAMELICAAMRIENELFYERVKGEYDFIVSDRGYFDHLAYGDVNCDQEFTTQLFIDCVSKHTRKPDLVFYFSVDNEEASRRRAQRGQAVDAIEIKGEAYQQSVASRFERHIEGDKSVHLINANVAVEEVFRQVLGVFGAVYGI